MTIKKGDFFRLQRRYSQLNGWSVKEAWDGKIVEATEVEDRPNGSITFKHPDGQTGLVFRDAVGEIITRPTEIQPT